MIQPSRRKSATTDLYNSSTLKQDNNLHQPTELCYPNQHVDTIIVHHVTLGKTQTSTQSIALL